MCQVQYNFHMAQFIIISYESYETRKKKYDLIDIVFFSQEVDEYIYISKCFWGEKQVREGILAVISMISPNGNLRGFSHSSISRSYKVSTHVQKSAKMFRQMGPNAKNPALVCLTEHFTLLAHTECKITNSLPYRLTVSCCEKNKTKTSPLLIFWL